MYCRKCGKQIPDNEKHCYHCGEIFEQKKNMTSLMIAIHAVAGLLIVALLVFFVLTMLGDDVAETQTVEAIPTTTPEIKQQEEVKEPHPLQDKLVGMWDNCDEYDYWAFVFEEDGSYIHYKVGQSTKQILETYRGTYEVESDNTILIDDIPRLFEFEGDVFSIADQGEDYLLGYMKVESLTLYDGEKLREYTVGKWECKTEGYEDLMFHFLEESTYNQNTDEEINFIVYKNDEIIDDGYYGVGHDGLLYFDNEPQDYVMQGWKFIIVYEGEILTLEEVWE